MVFGALFKAHAITQLRNRSAVFWNFAFPIFLMALFGLVFGKGGGTLEVGVASETGSAFAQPITQALEKIKDVEVDRGPKPRLIARLKEGEVDAVVYVGSTGKDRVTRLEIYHDPANALEGGMVQGIVSSVVEGVNREISRVPSLFQVSRHSVRSERLNYISFLLPGVIGMAVMFSSLFGTAYPLVNDREKGILRRLRVTPMPLPSFIAAKAVGQMVIAFLQALLIILVGILLFGVEILGDWLSVATVLILGSLVFVTLGFVIAGGAGRLETVDPLANVVAMPMMFLSGTFFPVDQAPAWLQPVIQVLPLTYLNNALREVLIKGGNVFAVGTELGALAAATIIFFLLALRMFRWEPGTAG